MSGCEAIHLRGKFAVFPACAHPFLGLREQQGALGVLARADIGACQLKEFFEAVGLLFVVGLEYFAGAVQSPGAQQAFAK